MTSAVVVPRLAAHGLVREFGGGAGVHGIDLDVAAGEVHALVGLNGAGKTTLLRLLLGMLRPGGGSVAIDGAALETLEMSRWARVGHVVEYPLAYPELTARTNLALAARLHAVPGGSIPETVTAALMEFDLTSYADVRFSRLSQGNRHRVGLAAALQHRPDLIVLDEPTNTLDPRGVILLRESLRRRASEGAAVLISSHHLDEVARIARRITVISRGRVVGALDPSGIDLERAFFALVQADEERAP